VQGLVRTNAIDKKKMYEADFQKRVNANPQWKTQYGNLLTDLEAAYNEFKPYGLARDYYLEITSKIELFTIARQVNSLRNTKDNATKTAYSEALSSTKENLAGLYREYNPTVDRNLFEVLMEMYVKDQDSKIVSPIAMEQLKDAGNDFRKWANDIYGGEEFTAGKKVLSALEQNPAEWLENMKSDKAGVLYADMASTYNTRVAPRLNEIQNRINRLQRTYMQAQMEVMKEKKFYPDANSTLRITYGKVKGYTARDAVKYDCYTYLDGVIEKFIPGDYEFDVPKKLRELYNNKDYGQYGKNGRLPVCFIAANHTTGGNSGSPALDGYGNLVGLNFDRTWEGTMSDINYDPSICRNIMVDIRYVLFIIDKYAEASQLIRELRLVHPKKK
jgi:Peptidase S46